MKIKSLLIVCLFFVVLNSCKKSVSTEQANVSAQNEIQSQKNIEKIDVTKINLEYQTLLSKVKSKQISFEEYRMAVKLLLLPYKALNEQKKKAAGKGSTSHIATARNHTCPSNPFDACHWTYHPSPCPIPEPDPACDEFYATECIGQCGDAYTYAGDVLGQSEQAADANYQQALGNCNSILEPGPRAVCISAAEQAHFSAMGSILAGYAQAYLLWEQCELFC